MGVRLDGVVEKGSGRGLGLGCRDGERGGTSDQFYRGEGTTAHRVGVVREVVRRSWQLPATAGGRGIVLADEGVLAWVWARAPKGNGERGVQVGEVVRRPWPLTGVERLIVGERERRRGSGGEARLVGFGRASRLGAREREGAGLVLGFVSKISNINSSIVMIR